MSLQKFAMPAIVLLSAPMTAAAADTPTVDTSRWVCRYCPFEDGRSGTVEFGAGYVSDAAAKFGEYNALDRQGGFAIGNAQGRYRQQAGTWLDLSVQDLGLDSRALTLAGGKQGRYTLSLNYKELQHSISTAALTPYLGSGTTNLSLPASWVPGGTTRTMPALAGSLHGADLGTQRKQVDLGASMDAIAHWQLALKFRHETKTGALRTAGAFEFNASQLVLPVDYSTDQIDASAAYNGKRVHARLAYYGSKFSNNDSALTWTNPYLPLAAGATSGELAGAPGNEFHQLALSAGLQLNARTQATAEMALGHMRQNEAFVPITPNQDFALLALPRASLDGRVETVNANFRLTSALTDKTRVTAAATYDDRDNRTAQAIFAWVTTDTATALPRANMPYSSRHTLYRLDADFQLSGSLRVDAGYDYDTRKRDLQEISEAREARFWGKLNLQATDRAGFTIKSAHAQRNVSPYEGNAAINPPENPLLRKYNMADRARDSLEVRLDYALGSRSNFGLAGDYGWDNYRKSTLGLLDAEDTTWTADASFMLSERTSATTYLNHQQISSHQANGALMASAPTWFASNVDRIDTAGAGLRHQASRKLNLGADYTLSRSTGQVTLRGATPAFPDLYCRLDSLKVYGDYQLKQRLSLHLAYWYEAYRSENWMVDGVTANTIANVISLGQGSPIYHVNVITLSGRYAF